MPGGWKLKMCAFNSVSNTKFILTLCSFETICDANIQVFQLSMWLITFFPLYRALFHSFHFLSLAPALSLSLFIFVFEHLHPQTIRFILNIACLIAQNFAINFIELPRGWYFGKVWNIIVSQMQKRNHSENLIYYLNNNLVLNFIRKYIN